MPGASEFITREFLSSYNEQFSVAARDPETAFKPFQVDKDLRSVFCSKETRKVGGAQTFSYAGEIYLMDKARDYRFRNVHVLLHDGGRTDFEIYGKKVSVTWMNQARTEIILTAAARASNPHERIDGFN